jgi:hypothetical protein
MIGAAAARHLDAACDPTEAIDIHSTLSPANRGSLLA